MTRYFICEIFLYFSLLIHLTFATIPTFNCTEGIYKTSCDLIELRLTASNKSIKIIPHDEISKITVIGFYYSKVEILTSDFCEALPYIEDFGATNLGLKSIDPNAFEKCTRMKELWMYSNSISTLPPGLFDTNILLTHVRLYKNQLTKIDGNLFKNNLNLAVLVLNNNQLEEFSFGDERERLGRVDLSDNHLSFRVLESVIEKCPKLWEIQLKGNNISCQEQMRLIEILKEQKKFLNDLEKCTEVQQ